METGAVDTKLYIDLDICTRGECTKCVVDCSYFYHPDNNGILSVAEVACYALVCRQCEEPDCVAACPSEALEVQEDGILTRHNMRCVSCRTCSHACPYGTIYPEFIPMLAHACDFCTDRRIDAGEPACAKTCPYGAIGLRGAEQERSETDFDVGENLIIHSTHWMREKA